MKNFQIIIILILGLFVTNHLYSQEYVSQDIGSTGWQVQFINANTGFAGAHNYISGTGNANQIFKTTNKGINWTLLKTVAYSVSTYSKAIVGVPHQQPRGYENYFTH